ncbi:MAG: hypothetical protein JXB03_07805 [Spirochaetales bacterium]|nr:hypothetical protein [Spirochaetales bacterium]
MKRFALLLLAAIFVFRLHADTPGTIESNMFLPPDFYVGDMVELRMVVTPSAGSSLSIPKDLPKPFWMRIESLGMKQLSGGSYEIRLIFASYFPGTRTLPALDLGGMVIDKVKIHTLSVLSQDNPQLKDIRPPMILPGTVLLLVFAGLLLLGGPLVAVFSVNVLKNQGRLFMQRLQWKLPYRRFTKLTKELNSSFFSMSDRDFYFSLSEGLRNYLSDRTGEDFLTVTLEEIGTLLPAYLNDFEDQKQMIKLLHYADLIKFSGGGSILEKKRKDLDDASSLIRSIEAGYGEVHKEDHDVHL